MDIDTYMEKRKELELQNPRIMHPHFLRGTRIAIGLLAIVLVKVVSGSLPFYRNKCLYDNIQLYFQPLQKHFQSTSAVLTVELFIFILSKYLPTNITNSLNMLLRMLSALDMSFPKACIPNKHSLLFLTKILIRHLSNIG